MIIDDVEVLNWTPPGREWWEHVQARPDEPLIEATMTMTLSWREYDALIQQHRINQQATNDATGGER